MSFSENLRAIRIEKGLTQDELAKKMGMTKRTIIGYETGGRKPKKPEKYQQLAAVLGCTVKDLLGESAISTDTEENKYADFVNQAGKAYGSRGKQQAAEVINSVYGLFAGGELNDEDKDAVMQAIQEVYWKAKEDNKKYTPRKFRDDQ